MATKYPIVMAHGIVAKQRPLFNAFGKIGKKLSVAGYDVYISDHDAFGRIETNAVQLRDYILRTLEATGAEKVNIIAHSKGGLDAKHMITELGMEDKVASLTTLCTPHKGSIIASRIWGWPGFIKKPLAFFINLFFRLFFRDKHPDALGACEQLRAVDESEATLAFSEKVYCQSYSSSLKRGKDCFIMALPMKIFKHYENVENDGLVSRESAKFGNYRGDCLDISISHAQIIDRFSRKSQKEKIYAFYIGLAEELGEMGF